MRRRQAKPLLYALLLSFLIHLVVLLGPTLDLPDWAPTLTVPVAPPVALTVALQVPTTKPAPAAASRPPPRQPRRVEPSAPTPPPVGEFAATPEPTIEAPPEPTPGPAPIAPTLVTPAAAEPPPAPSIALPSITTRREFPELIEVRYSVHHGDQGIRLGTTIHKWHIVKNKYLLSSTTEASGLFSLFYSGRYIMTSSGEITADGLQPNSFWIQRGQSSTRTESAEFNWETKTLDYGKGNERHSATIASGTQDQLSVFYQLALTAPHRERVQIALTTGRKFNQYTYQVVGEEILDTALGQLKTQHLARVTANPEQSDRADIWLALEHRYLPVRFRLGTRDGEVLDHWIAELRVAGTPIEPTPQEVQ